MGIDFRKVPQHAETKLWSKRLAFVIVLFIQNLYAYSQPVAWFGGIENGAEILASFVETIVFVNTLHPLPEAFLAFFLSLLLPPIQ